MYYSFVMMKPDALERGLVQTVVEYLKRGGVELELVGCRRADQERIAVHYAEAIGKYGGDFEEKARRYFEGRYVLPMLVKSPCSDVVSQVRKIVGATDPAKAEKGTIRGDLGTDSFADSGRENRMCENLIHASDSEKAVFLESRLWFGETACAQYLSIGEGTNPAV